MNDPLELLVRLTILGTMLAFGRFLWNAHRDFADAVQATGQVYVDAIHDLQNEHHGAQPARPNATVKGIGQGEVRPS